MEGLQQPSLLCMASRSAVSVTCGQLWSERIKWKIPEICKLHIVPSSVMKSRVVLLHPAQDVSPPFVQQVHTVSPTHGRFVATEVIRLTATP